MAEQLGIIGETGPFSVNERVLIPFTDKNYEAKILKAEYRQAAGESPAGWYYFVHYNGWNKKYDTWVEDAGLIKMPQGSEPAMVSAQAAVGTVAGIVSAATGAAVPKIKRVTMKDKFLKSTAGVSLNPTEGAAVLLELDMPASLKQALLDDYDAIVEEGRLQPLPRRPSVAVLLQRYTADAQQHRGSCEPEEELALGLRTYFDKALVVALLYRGEREQAVQALSDGRVASCVYGAEHLVRLFVKLPELMAISAATELQAASVSVMVQDLMMWMLDNAESLFMAKDDYIDGLVAAAPEEDEEDPAPGGTKPNDGTLLDAPTSVPDGAADASAATTAAPTPPSEPQEVKVVPKLEPAEVSMAEDVAMQDTARDPSPAVETTEVMASVSDPVGLLGSFQAEGPVAMEE